jgi:ATP-binding cassette subfamily B protein/ATP-binding cassette subfamily B multidrug efflux pump
MRHTEQKVRLEMKMFSEIEDTLTNIHTIYSTDTINYEKQRLDLQQQEYCKIYKTNLKICTRIKLLMSILSIIIVISLFLYLFRLYQNNNIEKTSLISLTVLFIFMTRFLGYTCRRITEGMITIGSMLDDDKFINILNESTVADGQDTDYITSGQIVFENVTFGYSDENIVFRDLNIVIPARSSLLLIGDSGSGKSTFLRLLLGFFTLQSGTISIDNHDISTSSRSYLRQNIAYINQSTRLFDRPIMENILYGCSHTTPDDVLLFLQERGLTDMFRHVSLDDPAGIGGENLSGGMRQIVLLLRCYFRDCPIVIIDEGVSNIDQKHRRYAIRIIQEMFHKKTVIVVSHDTDITPLFQRKLVFSAGSITLEN